MGPKPPWYDGFMRQHTDQAGQSSGCALFAGGLLALGLLLATVGFLVGDLRGYNWHTGERAAAALPLYIIGAVFGGIGAFGLVVLVLGRPRGR